MLGLCGKWLWFTVWSIKLWWRWICGFEDPEIFKSNYFFSSDKADKPLLGSINRRIYCKCPYVYQCREDVYEQVVFYVSQQYHYVLDYAWILIKAGISADTIGRYIGYDKSISAYRLSVKFHRYANPGSRSPSRPIEQKAIPYLVGYGSQYMYMHCKKEQVG